MPTILTSVPTFVDLLQTLCKYKVLEQTLLLHPLKHYLDNIALQEVVYYYHDGEKKTINKGRQTDHYNP